MSSSATTGKSVGNPFAFLFAPVKVPFMPHKYPRPAETPMTFGEDKAVRMSQRTLVLILGGTAAAVLGWTALKSDNRDNSKAIADLIALRAADVAAQKADHDLLVSVAKGVESLQRRADWQDRRDNRTSSTTTPSR